MTVKLDRSLVSWLLGHLVQLECFSKRCLLTTGDHQSTNGTEQTYSKSPTANNQWLVIRVSLFNRIYWPSRIEDFDSKFRAVFASGCKTLRPTSGWLTWPGWPQPKNLITLKENFYRNNSNFTGSCDGRLCMARHWRPVWSWSIVDRQSITNRFSGFALNLKFAI